jgi:hypothetical protein
MRWIVAGLSLSMMLGGCTTMQLQQQKDSRGQTLAAQAHCVSQRQCEAMWSAAVDWVNHNCSVKIQNMNDPYVETYHWFDTSLACRVIKDPQPNGGYGLSVIISCRNMLGCKPDVYDATRAFNAKVSGAIEQFAGQ